MGAAVQLVAGQVRVGDATFPGALLPDGRVALLGAHLRRLRLGERDDLVALAAQLAGRDAVRTLARLVLTAAGGLGDDEGGGDDEAARAVLEAVALHLAGAEHDGALVRTRLLAARAAGAASADLAAVDADDLADGLADALTDDGGWTRITLDGAQGAAARGAPRSPDDVRDHLAAALLARAAEPLDAQLARVLVLTGPNDPPDPGRWAPTAPPDLRPALADAPGAPGPTAPTDPGTWSGLREPTSDATLVAGRGPTSQDDTRWRARGGGDPAASRASDLASVATDPPSAVASARREPPARGHAHAGPRTPSTTTGLPPAPVRTVQRGGGPGSGTAGPATPGRTIAVDAAASDPRDRWGAPAADPSAATARDPWSDAGSWPLGVPTPGTSALVGSPAAAVPEPGRLATGSLVTRGRGSTGPGTDPRTREATPPLPAWTPDAPGGPAGPAQPIDTDALARALHRAADLRGVRR
ncbi:hypothetical protein [Cellulomonas palmilytica]|uniref:hypothetical protein n=1 Tax=Cellulomonas palmilytica TaxID=2608402 RepID=UPI001F167F02|nr:hypothetical protein [Cellulomonas palmilytica]UJP39260.1 hypothetical protein F1D97_13045 [Cellulomonas palmilytica]